MAPDPTRNMPKMDEKLQMIATSIILQAEQERADIIAEANRTREEELSSYKDHVIEELYERVQRETGAIRQKSVEDRARAEQSAHRELLSRREELTASVFSAARLRLLEYASTAKYREALLKGLGKADSSWDHTATTIYLREEDMALAPEIETRLPGCRVEASRGIRIGGFQLRNTGAGILLDETLDQKLAEQRPWFLQECQLKTV